MRANLDALGDRDRQPARRASRYLPVLMQLANPLPHSAEKLCELRADLEHELAVAVRRGGTREDLAAILLVLRATDQRLERIDGDRPPTLERRAAISAQRRTSFGNGR